MSTRLTGVAVECRLRTGRTSRSQVVWMFECMGSPWKIAFVIRIGAPVRATSTRLSPQNDQKPLT